MVTTLFLPCNSSIISVSYPKSFLGFPHRILSQTHLCYGRKKPSISTRFVVLAVTQGSTESSKSEESIPSWAKPDSDEPPPWARDEAKGNGSEQKFEIPFFVYLIASAITAIAAIGSVFEYVNQKPVFGILSSDSIFYAPLLGFFAFTGIPTAAFLWFKSVQVANKEAEEQDRRDGFL
ncbi:Proteasome endopeptidase complex [Quillaja saponaria]|uniref:Proteasome endopeptidase complex n=1 Tax=Quillaja saponaria TaxID=32244 RepID=A0AAD7VEB4_QUISA|nr:Proteasome endopeptidase complex [Quillaja saponaria]